MLKTSLLPYKIHLNHPLLILLSLLVLPAFRAAFTDLMCPSAFLRHLRFCAALTGLSRLSLDIA